MMRFASFLPERKNDIHKGDRGGVLIVGGCSLYRGAPLLAARGALRSGCGLLVVFSEECVCSAVASSLPEAIVQSGLFSCSRGAVIEILNFWKPRMNCLVLGPGIGRSDSAGNVVRVILETWQKPLIVDGDGLYWLAHLGDAFKRRDSLLLTPHEGEAARLLGTSSDVVRRSRKESASEIASRYGIVLLKGRETLIDDGLRCEIIAEGNQALAIPGSGDVLAGAVAALSASGIPLFPSACLGAFVHGRAGRDLSQQSGIDGILASEVADAIPLILRRMREGLHET